VAVLVVDNNATNRHILQDQLSGWLMRPTVVDGASAALDAAGAAAAEGRPFPLVLLDAHAMEQDGLALASEIRSRPHLGRPVLVMLSSSTRCCDRDKYHALGIRQRLVKPVKPSDLLESLCRSLEPDGDQVAGGAEPHPFDPSPSGGDVVSVAAASGEPAPGTGSRVPFDLRPLRRRIGEDDQLLGELVRLVCADAPRLLDEIRAAVASGDARAVERASHLLKGAVSHFVATDVVRAAHRLETLGRDGDLRQSSDAFRTLEDAATAFLAALEGAEGQIPVGDEEVAAPLPSSSGREFC
jgi:CheY-like chemotaxis protein